MKKEIEYCRECGHPKSAHKRNRCMRIIQDKDSRHGCRPCRCRGFEKKELKEKRPPEPPKRENAQ